MKLITRDTDYAIRALCCIASSKKDLVSVASLVDELAIPRPFLRKILQVLNKKGFLKSYKGKGGGFSVKAEPSKITVFDIVEIFQGPFQMNEHKFKGKVCPNLDTCKFKNRLDNIENHVMKELKLITIEDLLK